MGYQMLLEDVLKINFKHPHVAVGLILVMSYLIEMVYPKSAPGV